MSSVLSNTNKVRLAAYIMLYNSSIQAAYAIDLLVIRWLRNKNISIPILNIKPTHANLLQYIPLITKDYGKSFSKKLKSVTRWTKLARKYAAKYKVPLHLVLATIHAESRGNPNAVSATGPVGLMQMAKKTAEGLGFQPSDRKIPEKAIEAGVKLQARLLKRYNGDVSRAILAYHQGPFGANQLLQGTSLKRLKSKYGTGKKYNDFIKQKKEAIEYVPRVLKLMEVYK